MGCPQAVDDKTNQPWAMPYDKQMMYTFFDKKAEDAAKANPIKLPASKQKFSTHATFQITRHPKGGVGKLKDTVGPPQNLSVSDNLAAADSWLDGTEGKPGDSLPEGILAKAAASKPKGKKKKGVAR